MSLFDERDLVEITSDVYPGERLCRNPLLDRARKRQELLEATEARTDCRSDTARQAPGRSGSGRSSAGWRSTSRGPSTMTVSSPMGAMRLRSLPRLLYVVRLPQSELDGPARLQAAELRGTGLPQPQGPEGPSRLPPPRAHIFLCMLAYYMAHATEAHAVRRRGCRRRPSVVAPAEVSASARAKATTKRTPGGGTASAPSSAILRPATPWRPALRAPNPSRSPHGPRRSREGHSSSWA